VLSRARKQDVYSKENPERIIGDEGNFDKYPDKREHRNYKRKGEYRMLCAPPANSRGAGNIWAIRAISWQTESLDLVGAHTSDARPIRLEVVFSSYCLWRKREGEAGRGKSPAMARSNNVVGTQSVGLHLVGARGVGRGLRIAISRSSVSICSSVRRRRSGPSFEFTSFLTSRLAAGFQS
jgi:hypothetical protein